MKSASVPIAIAALLLLSVSFSFPQLPLPRISVPYQPVNTVLASFPIPLTTDDLPKRSDGGTDSSVVYLIEAYEWNETDWRNWGHIHYTYDNLGRVAEYSAHSENDDTIYFHMTIEYNRFASHLRQTIVSTMLSDQLTYTTKTFNDIYGYNHTTSFFGYLWMSPPLPAVEYTFGTCLYDSLICVSLMLDTLTGSWDTIVQYHYTHSYDKNTGIYTFASIDDSLDTSYIYKYEIASSKTADGLIDTFTYYDLDDTGARVKEYRTVYSYNGSMQLISATSRTLTIATGAILDESTASLSYNADGRIDSYSTANRDTLTGAWINEMKLVYFYTTIPIAATRQLPSSRSTIAITAAMKQGRLVITPPADMAIEDVVQFDLRGRVVQRAVPRRPYRQGEAVSVPWRSTGRSVTILQVRTDRGIVYLKVKEPSASD